MKKKALFEIFDDLKIAGILILVLTVIMQIVMFKENLLITLRVSFSYIYMALPGIFLMRIAGYEIYTRFIVGSLLSLATIGIVSYYLGIIGFGLQLHWILPVLLIAGEIVYVIFLKD